MPKNSIRNLQALPILPRLGSDVHRRQVQVFPAVLLLSGHTGRYTR